MERIRESFLRVGWMLPVLVPTAASLGRALGNVLFFSYLIWALLALRPRDLRLPPVLLGLYCATVLVFLLSATVAVDPGEAVHTWFRWFTYTLALPITLMVLAQQTLDEQRLLRWAGIAALAALLYFAGRLVYVWLQGEDIAGNVNGMVMAYVLPFLVVWVRDRWPPATARWLQILLLVIAIVALLLANSSTEVLVAAGGLLVLTAFLSRFGLRILWAAAVLLPAVLVFELLPKLQQVQGVDWQALLDIWSSHRTTIWLGAFQSPPENVWLGVGMGNAQFFEPLLSVKVKSMHNFLVDTWFETGVLGLVASLSLLAYLMGSVLRALRAATPEAKRRAAPWVASIVAILIAASLDNSYGSLSFCLLMLFELAVLRVFLQRKAA